MAKAKTRILNCASNLNKGYELASSVKVNLIITPALPVINVVSSRTLTNGKTRETFLVVDYGAMSATVRLFARLQELGRDQKRTPQNTCR